MRALNKRERNIFILCLTLMAMNISNHFIFKPLINFYKDLDQKILLSKKQFKKNLKIIHNNQIISRQYNDYLDNLKQKDSDERQMSTMISNLEGIADKADLRLSEIKSRKIKNVEFYKVFSVSIKMNGNFDQITHFLHTLQSNPYLFLVKELQLKKQSRRNNLLNIHLIINQISIP